ncbi:MAG TPA: AbrB/MazE/SpoVT family DNA-binding domain-containing protein [Thauera aminoaromatica]|jgi:AbrB family looped-hinge helix DNA binding protein|nr:AbrB/MazE/SpoVT family DNA-binding domain-containing protein [Pseudomonadales bacterium]MCP5332911.1 AbrB/MazE/SpoVT family DNA-binding domain-containing protein [Pseudomonadales bacterium]HNB05522.1 AbrB/MazE/SpoVT family DNA-binding domain-containing protein [Thauera aminoaromatica]
MEATLTSKGQVTIPKAVRDALHLRSGDRLDFILEADGTVRVLPITGSVKRLKGMLPKPPRPLTVEEMDEAIAKGAAGA